MPDEAPERLTVGRFGAPHGVRGWIRVHSWTAPPENLLDYAPWWIHRDGHWVAIGIDEGRVHGKGLIAHVAGYDSPETVRMLAGADIAIGRDQLAPAGEDEYYWADLIGAGVVTREGVELGRVDSLFDNGAHDVMVVRGERERLIPFVRGHYVTEIDPDGRRIVVDWDPED